MRRQFFRHSCCIIILICHGRGGPFAVAAAAVADDTNGAAERSARSTAGSDRGDSVWPLDSSHRLRRSTATIAARMKTRTARQEDESPVSVSAATAADDDESGPVYHVPTFDLAELRDPSSSSSSLRHVLGDTGLLAISAASNSASTSTTTTVDAIRQVRRQAMATVCSCLRADDTAATTTTSTQRTVSGGMLLRDGTIRTTLATATIGATPIPLEPMAYCPDDPAMAGGGGLAALEALRDVVHGISQEFIAALDRLLLLNDDVVDDGNKNNTTTTKCKPPLLHTTRGRSYTTIHDIVKASHNLEHFHLYEKKKKSDDDCQDDLNDHEATVLPIHTDAGLFLVFVPGLDCDATTIDDNDDTSSLWVQRRSGKLQRAVFAPDTFGVLMGVGAEHWLQLPSNRLSLRATRHAVSMHCQSRRAWYGMMHLVPADSILQDLPQRTFADLRRSLASHAPDRKYHHDHHDNNNDNDEVEAFATIGCGSIGVVGDDNLSSSSSSSILLPRVAQRRRLQMVDDASACNNVTNFFCWMSCLPIPDPPAISSASSSSSSSGASAAALTASNTSLYCLDPHTLDASGGDVTAAVKECTGFDGRPGALHNDICTGQWHASVAGLPEAAAVKEKLLLSSNSGNVSSNDGNGGDNAVDLAPSTRFCYGGTSMYMDGFHWLGNTCVIYLFPAWIVTTSGALVGACIGTFLVAMMLEGIIRLRRWAVAALPTGTWRRLLVSATIYGLQLTIGYLIMLIVMTYSGPLFLSVILGLMGGHVAFNADQVSSRSSPTSSVASKNAAIDARKETAKTTTAHGSTDEPKNEEPSSCCGTPSADEGENKPKTTTTTRGDDLVPEGCTPCCQNTL